MRLQSLAAVNQARLLLGPQQVVRIEPPNFEAPIRMDDWRRSVENLVPAADEALVKFGDQVSTMFLLRAAEPFVPTALPS
jgi:hypothetical protein